MELLLIGQPDNMEPVQYSHTMGKTFLCSTTEKNYFLTWQHPQNTSWTRLIQGILRKLSWTYLNLQTDMRYHWYGKMLPQRHLVSKWQKKLGRLPENAIQKILDNTTQFYVSIEHKNRKHPWRHYKSAYPALQCKWWDDIMAVDTFFPSQPTSHSSAFTLFFVGQQSNQWFVQLLKTEYHNYQVLQDQIWCYGAPTTMHSDFAQSKYKDREWTAYLRKMCIKQQATHQNPNGSFLRNPRLDNWMWWW